MRICPICDTKTELERCPNDGYMTIDIEQFQTGANKDPNIGKVLKDQYRIVELLGQGGMGSVYKGVNIPLRQDVAVKIMEPVVRKNLEQVKRFHVEALATSRLRHPNTVRVFDFGQENDGTIFLVMEFLEGRSLEEALLKDGRFSPKRALQVFRMTMGSLAEAHSYGIVHRDLKPSNIMLTDMPGAHDFVKVVDFGIAKILQGEGMEKGLTKTGMIVGSPEYMSPEQIAGKAVDARTDLYSLGLVMYRLISGKLPYTGDTPITVMLKQGTEPLPPFPNDVLQKMPAGLNELIRKMAEKAPESRPVSAQEVLDALDHLGEPIKSVGTPPDPEPVQERIPQPEPTPAPQASQKETVSITGQSVNEIKTNLFDADLADDRPDDDFEEKKGFPWLIVVIVLAILGGAGIFFMLNSGKKASQRQENPVQIAKKTVKTDESVKKHATKPKKILPKKPKTQKSQAKAKKITKAVQKPITDTKQDKKNTKSAVPAKKIIPPKKAIATNIRTMATRPKLHKIKPVARINSIKNTKKTKKPDVKRQTKDVKKLIYETVTVDSSPMGATILLRGRKKGVTPGAKIRIPKNKNVYVTIKKSGYKSKHVRLNTRKKHVKIDLEPILF